MDPSAELASPTAMKELVQYFETHGRLLDRQEPKDSVAMDTSNASSFVSCIRFNGVPILPPVMTNSRIDEARQDRHSAAFHEKRLKARQRKHLMRFANTLVENAESGAPSESKAGKSRLQLDRPSVLKPVVTTAWGSVTASSATTTSVQSLESVSAVAASSLANTFATAEQGQEEFGLQTLDSVCSDFMSLEETLPTDFNGVPLTSTKQQKISHDLLRLSKILKVKDMNSTGGSDISELPTSECVGDAASGDRGRGGGTSALDNVSASLCHHSQDTTAEAMADMVTDNTASALMDNSADGSPAELSSQGESNLSGATSTTTTSGMSSANTSRSSPRSLKNNTVKFASFVTEYIDTSASLSSENITVVKKKLPGEKNGRSQVLDSVESVSSAGAHASTVEEMEGLLSNVSLAEPDSPLSSIPPSVVHQLPFQLYAKADPSLSDKENDAKQANKLSSGRIGVSGSSVPRASSSSKAGAGGSLSQARGGTSVSDSQGSSKSDATATNSESSNSTLIEEAAAATASHDSITHLPLNIVEPQEENTVDKGPQKTSGAAAPRKPKKLPPEPTGAPYQQQRHAKATETKEAKDSTKDNAEGPFRKGHVRRGSYTLSSPSPALLRVQALTGEAGVRAMEDDRTAERKVNNNGEDDHTKPLNIPVQSSVPSEPEATGKAEHINKYLSQVQLHNSEDVTASQLSADFSPQDPAASTGVQNSMTILQSLASSHQSEDGEALHQFQSLRENLLEQQKQELEELFIQQRREQMLLQAEIEEHQKRMKEQQDFLACNAPENQKVQSQSHEGELSPDSNTANVKSFQFPNPKQSGISLHGQRGASGSTSPGPVLLNASSSSASPKVRRLVLRSPLKFHPGRRYTGRVIVPPEAYEPEMRVKLDKLTATAKGFLTRRLLQSDKVQELVKTIKDTREFAFSFQSETPIRRGDFSNQDRTLLERIVAQLQAALLDVHDIFFDTPVSEQMALIEQTRMNSREKQLKSSTDHVMRGSAPRISTATLKAQERRRRAQEAEASVFGASMARPRTAPPSTNSPRSQTSVDLSGPLKRHYQFLLARSMKPAAMQAAHQYHQSTSRSDSSRSDKERPQTAPERSTAARPKKPSNTSAASVQGPLTENVQTKLNIRLKQPHPSQPSQPAGSKSSKLSKSSKSWR